MKVHRPIVQQVVLALTQTFGEGYQADKVIERLFKSNRQLGSRDRKFVAESTYEIVRWWRLLWAGLGVREPSLDAESLWRLIGVWIIWKGESLPAWNEFKDLQVEAVNRALNDGKKDPAIRESVPDWLFKLGADEMGENEWAAMLTRLNREAPVVLRTNTLKSTRDRLVKELEKEGIETEPASEVAPLAVILRQRRNIFTSATFKQGFFEVQDGASQQVAPLLEAEPGDRVIDACAGAGGKSLHLAALMRNKGKIIAMDIYDRKLDELKRRAARGGCDIIEARLIEGSKTIKRLIKSADRVLLDVPCSGLGVLRRNPDSKWKLTMEELLRLRQLQAEILSDYSEMVKPGGRLVYATCSVLPSENERQVQAFLSAKGSTWELVQEKRFIPDENRFDGFYAAALKRLT